MSAKEAADAEVLAGAATDADAGEKPKRRGRPKGSGRKPKAEDASSEGAQETTQRKTSRRRKTSNDGDDDLASSAPAQAQPTEAPPVSETRLAESDEITSADDGDEDQSAPTRRGRSQGRRNSSRRGGLNYRDLQSKILPELHLLAKEVGLSDYRQMNKEELSVAVLERAAESEGLRLVRGYLEISSDGYGFLQESMLQNDTRSVIVSAGLIKQFRLRTGDFILGKSRKPRDNERYGTLIRVEAVNGVDPFQAAKRPRFDDLVPTFPEERVKLETVPNEVSSRVIDLLAPIGRGQRGLIVAPPKAGKTTLLKKVANAVITNEPDIKVIVLLVDERPEEVTDFRESVSGVEVVASTFDEPPANHIRVAEFVHERARRIVEDGGHVMILLDSITRLALGRTTWSRRPPGARSRAVWTVARCTGPSASWARRATSAAGAPCRSWRPPWSRRARAWTT